MTHSRQFRFLSLAIPAFLLPACSNVEFTHVKPGHSARAALAARNSPPLPAGTEGAPLPVPADANAAELAPVPLPPPPVGIVPEPGLPDLASSGDKVADLYTRGCVAMKAGRTDEAITALQEAVKLDPNFVDAWTKLVLLYQSSGQQDKATEAYKKTKQLGQPQGAGPASAAGGGLGLLP